MYVHLYHKMTRDGCERTRFEGSAVLSMEVFALIALKKIALLSRGWKYVYELVWGNS